jgi:2-iminobutanoate/2-iminopropanoate deaminase
MTIMRQQVTTSEAPAAIGPYSQAVAVGGNLLFTAGQLGMNPETGAFVGNTAADQARQALKNLMAILEAAGTGPEHVIKNTVFMADMNDFASVNEVYAEFFPHPPPARSAVEVARLPKDGLVEIECIALIP